MCSCGTAERTTSRPTRISAMSVVVGSRKPMLCQLTGLRAIAAFWVLLLHFQKPMYELVPATEHLRRWVDPGGLGVQLFFVLSGFVISYTYADRLAKFSWGEYHRFIWSRLARIYPIHFTVLIIILGLVVSAHIVHLEMPNPEFYRPESFVASLFMLQELFPSHPWNAPAWSITCEFAAYLAFPLIAIMLARLRSASATFTFACAAATVIGGTAIMISILPLVDLSSIGGPLPWLHIATEFTCGALLYAGWRSCKNRYGLRWDAVAAISAVLTVILLGFAEYRVSWQLATIPLLAAFVLGCAGSAGPIATLLSTRTMQWLGRISYSLYMVHVTVRGVVRQIVAPEAFTDSALVVRLFILGIYFGAAIATAGILYHFVEEPARNTMRSWLEKRENRRPAAER